MPQVFASGLGAIMRLILATFARAKPRATRRKSPRVTLDTTAVRPSTPPA